MVIFSYYKKYHIIKSKRQFNFVFIQGNKMQSKKWLNQGMQNFHHHNYQRLSFFLRYYIRFFFLIYSYSQF